MRSNYQPRNEQGWRVPREGTRSRKVYDLMMEGRSVAFIRGWLAIDHSTLGVLMFKIKNPNKTNARAALYYHTGTSSARKFAERNESKCSGTSSTSS